ncbi:O-antigen polymerase [Microbacterium sp. MYb64]|uniref:O-antigen polymerase n=1 Tax=Microbacterium sp. MYb64 TaxID=1848691 RepID=UPI000CFBE769|nr:O-antigen polymerase [Microbacterium sp. MYb64]PRB08869.1 hypothetical protein CQ044_00410 [Microbacterium sp. MYb64]
MIIGLAVCAVMLAGAWFARKLGMPKFNVVSAFTISWVAMIVIATVFGGLTDPIVEFTWVVILTGWASLFVGAIVGWALGKNRRPEVAAKPIVIDLRRTTRFHVLFTALLAVYLIIRFQSAWPLISAAGGWEAVLGTGANAYRSASLSLALSDSQEGLTGGFLGPLINYGTFIPGMLATYTGAVLWRGHRRLLGITPVVLSGFLGLLTLQRTSIMIVLLLFIIAVWQLRLTGVEIATTHKDSSASDSKRPRTGRFAALVATIALLGAAGSFLFVTTTARTDQSRGSGFQASIGEYVVGGIAGINTRSANAGAWPLIPADIPGHFDPSPGLGGYTFTGLWTVLQRIGFPVSTTRVNLDFTQATMFGDATVTNVVSALGEFYLDFRMPGLVILSFLLGLGGAFFQRRLIGSRRVTSIPITSFLLTFSFWSFFVAWSSDLRQLLVAVLGGLVLSWVVRARAESPGRRSPAGVANPLPQSGTAG